jgi:AcrR family transcriptional regulator
MAKAGATAAERISRRQVDKFAERRAQLAEAALKTLSELGYARTSLREIAQNSEFSHGVLHYYFSDKIDLILEGVRQYKAVCVTRYDAIVETSTSPGQLRSAFAAALAETLVVDGTMHRLWYDLRSQSLFEPSLRADVTGIDKKLEQMIYRIVSRYAELADVPVAVSSPVAYAMFDGLFQQALLHHLSGDVEAARNLDLQAREVLDDLVLASPEVRRPSRQRGSRSAL